MYSYECETWSLSLREEHRLGVLRRILRLKRDEVTGVWRKPNSEGAHNLYSTKQLVAKMNKSRSMRREEHVARMEEMRNAYTVLVGKSEGNRPLGKPRLIWEDNIKMYLMDTVGVE
jgi:hypothetical protein